MKRVLLFSSTVMLAALVGACSASDAAPDDEGASAESEVRAAEESNTAPLGRDVYRQLKPLANEMTLGFLGEDSGDPCTASFRRGPANDFSAREILRLFQFNVEAQLASGDVSFTTYPVQGKEFWDGFVDAQDDEKLANEVKALFTSKDVTDLAVLIPHDRDSFSAKAYLVARLRDKSLVALRGGIGGMSL